jgi:hypothetical protein
VVEGGMLKIMFDLFTKARMETSPAARTPSQLDQAPGLKSAWRIAHAIDDALKMAKSERRSFSSRVEDAVSRSTVTLGNDTTEYLEREPIDSLHLDMFDAEIRDRNAYLLRLEKNIERLEYLKTELVSGFPELDKVP